MTEGSKDKKLPKKNVLKQKCTGGDRNNEHIDAEVHWRRLQQNFSQFHEKGTASNRQMRMRWTCFRMRCGLNVYS